MAHDIDRFIAFLDAIGLAHIQHTHDDLRSHLIGTHAVLARWNLAEPVQRVGLFHSIYGTEGFPRTSVPLARRDEIRDLIGMPAEQLVYRYCAMSYASLRQSVEAGRPMLHDRFTVAALPMSQDAFKDLLWVKLADACEQADEATFQRRFFLRVAEVLDPVGVQRWQEEAARFAEQ